MIWALVFVAILALVFGPAIWVKWVMRRHAAEIPGMPGTGGELAQHLIDEHDLNGVTLEITNQGDHYSPEERVVRLSEANYEGKSLTAVAVAAHEVGHAIQHHLHDSRLEARTRLIPIANRIAQIGSAAMWLAPIIGILTRHPMPIGLFVVLGLSGLVARMCAHLYTLPVEWDASFGKALPILEKGQYIAPDELPIVKKILRAAAYTYFAAVPVGNDS